MIQEEKFYKEKFKLIEFKITNSFENPILVPNVGGIAREMTEKSQIMLIVNKFLDLSILNKVKFMINNIIFMPSLLKMDFAVGVKILCELEILKALEKQKEDHFVLHNQMVDMALALKNKKVIRCFFYLSKKYKFIPGIVSYNIEPLIKQLSSFLDLPKDLKIYTSINNNNLMNLKNINLNFINIE